MNGLYHLVYEDLTHLGLAMGMEYTPRSDWGYFSSVQKAKKKAEDYYYNHPGAILRKLNGKEIVEEIGLLKTLVM